MKEERGKFKGEIFLCGNVEQHLGYLQTISIDLSSGRAVSKTGPLLHCIFANSKMTMTLSQTQKCETNLIGI